MRISGLLSEDMVIPDLKAKERDEALQEMVRFLKERQVINHDEELFEKLVQRENLGSTAVGDGIAIPHCKLAEVTSPLIALAVSKKGVSFFSLNGKPTSVFFLVISPPENPSLSLQILAAIAQLVRKASSLPKRILAAKTPRRMIEVIREEEEKLHE